ncbi:hypothetical protein ABQE93_20910 [Mycolicibacterium sp. XJ662]
MGTRTTIKTPHTDDCIGVDGKECEPTQGIWDQPSGYWVNAVIDQAAEEAVTGGIAMPPWCAIRQRAWVAEALRDDVTA